MKHLISRFRAPFQTITCLATMLLIAVPTPVIAADEVISEGEVSADETLARELSQMNIGDLINLTVTSVSKKEEKLSEAAAAVFVITADDIRRSGATSIPEALRLAPGIHVGRINNGSWAITSRGFNGLFANKLLVLIDGRTVYTPLFAGVFWDTQDVMLEDIDRIEVIRGPGATLWGANAVNGVINITTKSSKQTQGGLVSGGGGTEERAFGSYRYGGEGVEGLTYRGYAKYFNRDNTKKDDQPGDSYDAWDQGQGGFRMEYQKDEDNLMTLQGDAYYGELQSDFTLLTPTPPTFSEPVDATRRSNGQNLLFRWTRQFAEDSDGHLQIYYDRVERDDYIVGQQTNTGDIEFQHRFSPIKKHELIWGGRYRFYHDDLDGSFTADFADESRSLNLTSGFLQDEITLIEDTLKLIVGSKVEHNQETGMEYQPSIKSVWTPDKTNTLWGAVSRAVRTPSRSNSDIILPLTVLPANPTAGVPPTAVTLYGNRQLSSEDITSFEIGYRSQPVDNFAVDIATFVNLVDGVTTIEPRSDGPFLDPSIGAVRFPSEFRNKLDGTTYGVEVVADYRPVDNWRLLGWYTWTKMNLNLDSSSMDLIGSEGEEDQTPENQFNIRSIHDLPYDLQFDAIFRYVDFVGDIVQAQSYFELDLRLGWMACENLELSVVGQNLLDSAHHEYTSDFISIDRAEIERGVYGKLVYTY